MPVLKDLLPPDYVHHLSLLVSALHILLGDVVPVADVNIAHEQLNLFYDLISELYGEEICTANMHTLIHLSQGVLAGDHCGVTVALYLKA